MFFSSFYGIYLNMEYALKERIGKPDLFTGRKKELAYFLNWINRIKDELSRSTAILARRKMGKTAFLERLFNITYYNNDQIIPFYYEIKANRIWQVDFCKDFFLTFIYQYIAFKTRKVEYLTPADKTDLKKAIHVAEKEGFSYLVEFIEGIKHAADHESLDSLWLMVRDAPRAIATRRGEFIVQMIDEFQFLNAMIYRDKNFNPDSLANDMAAGYLNLAESKIAPLLVSGSWVGWLMDDLTKMLPTRFMYHYLKNMPEDEAIETVFKYSGALGVPITGETAYMIAKMSEGNPFYICSILGSRYPEKNLTTLKGLTATLEFETLDNEGQIKSTWMEYVLAAFNKVNQKKAKSIVLYLCQHRDREVTRKELLEELSLDMDDQELEEKLKALINADIINQGRTNYDYQGVQDNIFDKVFRGVYEKEIQEFDVSIIAKEYQKAFQKIKRQYQRLLGKLNYQQGYFAEFMILILLNYRARKMNEQLKRVTRYLPVDFNFCDYARVWRYDAAMEYSRPFNVDIFARAKSANDYSIIAEIKNRETTKFSKDEVRSFMEKFAALKKLEKLERVIPFIFSPAGFTKEAEAYCQEMGIACSENNLWLEN